MKDKYPTIGEGLMNFALDECRPMVCSPPAEMKLKRLIQARNLVQWLDRELQTLIVQEAIAEGFTGHVDYSDELESLLDDYS